MRQGGFSFDIDREAYGKRLLYWLGEWPTRAPKITKWDKDSRLFHTLINIFKMLAKGEKDEARRYAVEILLHAVLDDGSVRANEFVLALGKGRRCLPRIRSPSTTHCLGALGTGRRYTAEKAVRVRLHGEEAKRYAREALPFLVGLERLLEGVKSDQKIYSKVEKLIEMAKAENVNGWHL